MSNNNEYGVPISRDMAEKWSRLCKMLDLRIEELRTELGNVESAIAKLEPDQVADRQSLDEMRKALSRDLLRCEVERFINDHDQLLRRLADGPGDAKEDAK